MLLYTEFALERLTADFIVHVTRDTVTQTTVFEKIFEVQGKSSVSFSVNSLKSMKEIVFTIILCKCCGIITLTSLLTNGTSKSQKNKTLWERILGRRCIRHIEMYISWEFACTSVQGLMWGVLSIRIVLYVVDWWLTFVRWNT